MRKDNRVMEQCFLLATKIKDKNQIIIKKSYQVHKQLKREHIAEEELAEIVESVEMVVKKLEQGRILVYQLICVGHRLKKAK